tara:strand:- start:41 stop:1126 length:1086 start_codon:yes stop_codon:yes gene_type:complete
MSILDLNLLQRYIGQDPLYQNYVNQGLLTQDNIVPFSADNITTNTPEEQNEYKDVAFGYTRPGNIGSVVEPEFDSRLFIGNLDFQQPKGPELGTYDNTGIMDNKFLDSYRQNYAPDTEVKPGMPPRDLTFREKINRDLNSINPNVRRQALTDSVGDYQYSPNNLDEQGYDGIYNYETESRAQRNKQIAETIGHEARHQILRQHPEYYQAIDNKFDINNEFMNLPFFSNDPSRSQEITDSDSEESLNRMLDFQAYNDPTIYKEIYHNMRMPSNLTNRFTNFISNQATNFTNNVTPNNVTPNNVIPNNVVTNRGGGDGRYGRGSDGQQSYNSGQGFGTNATTGGPVSNRTGRGRTDYGIGGLV